MAVPQVNKKFLSELEAMGFPPAWATRALHHSGNSNIEAAVNWIVDHENDPDINQMPLVPVNIEIEASEPSYITEQVKIKAQELRDRARREKEEEKEKVEREKEKERIRGGKELLEEKRMAEESERKRFLALRKVEKEEQKRARDKIRQKLQQDKAERRGRLGLPPEGPASLKSTTPIMQEEKNSVPVWSATLPSIATKAELMRDCLRSLKRNHMDDDAKVKRAFLTLLIYVRNVANNPNEEKYRKIRLSNPAFRDRVGKLKEGIEFLEHCGFERDEGGEFLFFPRDKVDMEVLRSAGNLLNSAITNPFFGLLSK
ncbi:uncharacterized protein LOC132269149 isoform X2 [Cornus florida]|uniref:uncharacterized protein LOC132269149 isoform X2 n=1 Tax=Cornus florida TaxID=4283 RepID=UPI00289C7B95|nr:uncharacterized protein LOC132269149 isoform X2 [Cornus florida]